MCPFDTEVPVFTTIRTALKLAGTVVEINERLTALEGNFDILDRAFKRREAQQRAENSRARAKDLEIAPAPEDPEAAKISPIGGVMRRKNG